MADHRINRLVLAAADFCNKIGHYRTHAPQQECVLIDHLVDASKHCRRNTQPNRSGCTSSNISTSLERIKALAEAQG